MKNNVSHVLRQKPYLFTGKDPIRVLEWIAWLVTMCDRQRMDEQEACDVLPLLMGDPTKSMLVGAARLEPNNPTRVRNWPSAVHYLLRFYAKDSHIAAARQELDSVKQRRGESEEDYYYRFD